MSLKGCKKNRAVFLTGNLKTAPKKNYTPPYFGAENEPYPGYRGEKRLYPGVF